MILLYLLRSFDRIISILRILKISVEVTLVVYQANFAELSLVRVLSFEF
jgi:hypothetical protein